VGKFVLVLQPETRLHDMAKFLGEFECKIDDKGRIALPSKLRIQIPSGMESSLVINRGFEKCLVVYVMEDWNKEAEKLSVLNEFNREARKFIRQYNNGASLISVDNASRVLIPKNLQEYAEIKDKVILSAYNNKIEIWSEPKYREEMAFDAEEFGALAEKLLGKKDDNPTI
jgi:MraZ protein